MRSGLPRKNLPRLSASTSIPDAASWFPEVASPGDSQRQYCLASSVYDLTVVWVWYPKGLYYPNVDVIPARTTRGAGLDRTSARIGVRN